MRRLLRYVRLWLALPEDERRARAGRVIDRALRRRPGIRRLGLAPEDPRRNGLGRALRVQPDELVNALRQGDARRGPLHGDLEDRAREIARRRSGHVDQIRQQATGLLQRRFDLLGSGPSSPLRPDGGIDWHGDWKSGLGWDGHTYHLDVATVRGDGADVKLPWELSRFQHLLVLGQLYRLAPVCTAAAEAEQLRRRCARESVEQIDDWITHNPGGLGVNWTCAMEVAIRAFNWLAALALFRDAPEWNDAFLKRLVHSLWIHGRHIRRNLEIGADGLTSNHYLSDLVGLYAIGCALPELREADPWRTFGRSALIEEMQRQVLPDGADFEASIPYHRLVTELFLHGALHARSAGDSLPDAFYERLERMLEFVAAYTRPDGTAPQWGDNDDGRLLPLSGYGTYRPHDHRHLLALGGALLGRSDLAAAAADRDVDAVWLLGAREEAPRGGPAAPESRAFPDAGYYVMRADDLHLAVPCGPVGTRAVGNHTHGDRLSLCLWAGGREWITDPGSGVYTADPRLRNRLRSTGAHATLQLGSREQNPFGAGLDDLFVMEERARPEVTAWHVERERVVLGAVHEGFSENQDRWNHLREIVFLPARRVWTVSDLLRREDRSDRPVDEEDVYLRFPLAPETEVGGATSADAEAEPASPADSRRLQWSAELRSGGASLRIALDLPAGSKVRVEDGVYSPRYGVTLAAPVILAILPLAREVSAVTVVRAPEAP